MSDEDDMTHLDVEDMSLEAVPKSKIPVQSDDSSSYEKDSSVSYYDALPRDGMYMVGTRCSSHYI